MENLNTSWQNQQPPDVGWLSPTDLRIARQVQARLLRHDVPRRATLEYDAYYLPAQGVGGDYHDFLELGPSRLGLVVGDVSGKGVSAALLMASLQLTPTAPVLTLVVARTTTPSIC